jgi:hypothetical protein
VREFLGLLTFLVFHKKLRMSADPDQPFDDTRHSGGRVLRNQIFQHAGNEVKLRDAKTDTKFIVVADQSTPPPGRRDMPATHACAAANAALLRCSEACPEEWLLGARTAACNDQRHALMKCLAKTAASDEASESAAPVVMPLQLVGVGRSVRRQLRLGSCCSSC